MNEAKLVDGQLMLATRCEPNTESREHMASKAIYFHSAMCLHFYLNLLSEDICQPIQQAVVSTVSLEKSEKVKYPYCESDYGLRVQNAMGGRIEIILEVWRNYGRRFGNTLAADQVFHRDIVSSRIDVDALSRRDLRAFFESGNSGTDSFSSKEIEAEGSI